MRAFASHLPRSGYGARRWGNEVREVLKLMRRVSRDGYAMGFAVGVLVLALSITLTVYSICVQFVEREAKLRFDNDSSSVEQQIAVRVRLYTDVLVTMRALFGEDAHITRAEFGDFVAGLDLPGRYPGFQTLNYAAYVRAAGVRAFEAEQRHDAILQAAGIDFAIHPPGLRDNYDVLTYLEPLAANREAVGLDLDAVANRRAAMETLRDTGEPISSGRLILDDRGARFVGLAMRMPVYRKGMPIKTVEQRRLAYVGSVGAGIRVNDMMNGLLGAETLRVIKFKIYDAGKVNASPAPLSSASLLYDSVNGVAMDVPARKGALARGAARAATAIAPQAPRGVRAAKLAMLSRQVEQPFAGRRWVIAFSANVAELSGTQRVLPDVVFVAGVVISLLLAGLAYALSSSRSRAVRLADKMTYDLRESEAARAEAQRIAHLGDWRVLVDDARVHLSREMARLIGSRVPTLELRALLRAIDPRDRGALFEQARGAMKTRDAFELECRYRSRRGRYGWLRVIGHAYGPADAPMLRGTALEITKQKSIELTRDLEHAFTLYLATAGNEFDVCRHLIESIVHGMDWDGGAFRPTAAGTKQLLCATSTAIDSAFEAWLLVHGPHVIAEDDAPAAPRWSVVGGGAPRVRSEGWLADAGIVTTFSFPLRLGSVVVGVAEFYARERRHVHPQALVMARSIVSQVSHFLQRRQAEDNLHFLATHDALTGLPNRLMFREHLDELLARARADATALHVLFIDLDRFKDVNDSLGHNVGDLLLRAVVARLHDALTQVEMIARLGGDEFVVLIKHPSDGGGIVIETIDAIQAALAHPIQIGGSQLQVSASIGVSSFPGDGEDAQTLLKHADMAMYGAKQRGKNTYQMYVRQMSMSLHRRVEMETQLRHAVENGEFTLVYQPRIDLRTNHCTGVEALLRWHNPALGAVPPSEFIPVAEETGAIVPIGAWVLREACRQAAEWCALGLAPIHVAVNLSARQFADPHLHESILDALADARLSGEYLELELTESMVMRHPEQAVRWLSAIKRTGVRLSIDDFGTGYSSLAYLNRFPIDTVKIDRSFIRNVPDSHSDTQITSAVIALGHSLGLTVIAEGAETQTQIDFLRKEGCDEVQGYFFSRPIPAADVEGFLGKAADPGLASSTRPSANGAGVSRPERFHQS
ncbi:diguanylate phosphodiesterase [Trinickia dabaoshanensis]|uniref:Diguanylate phosphodiesterase n=1 Tax=Trinickia dabaoshanensis TaxID=564714 RepID=A0A2N7VJE2_9BURK|nr:EAL domain-containing protein [Trinickia dabaoshanensis]PMS17276.1 diguanylate phosphodiesterase [Trinickia dabaoshanensis]